MNIKPESAGVQVSCSYGGALTAGSVILEVVEPVAFFKVDDGGPKIREYIIGLEGDGIPGGPGKIWVIHKPTFTAATVTLALVNREEAGQEILPPAVHMEFTRTHKGQSYEGNHFLWLGSGCEVRVGDQTFCLLPGDRFTFDTPEGKVHALLDSIKGRSSATFRFDKSRDLIVKRVV